jgi:hypothetical protein
MRAAPGRFSTEGAETAFGAVASPHNFSLFLHAVKSSTQQVNKRKERSCLIIVSLMY